MKKPELAKGLALASGLTEAEAADRLDRVVDEIIARLRKGKSAPVPGTREVHSRVGWKGGVSAGRGQAAWLIGYSANTLRRSCCKG